MGPFRLYGAFRVYGALYTYIASFVIFLSVLAKARNTIHISNSIAARTQHYRLSSAEIISFSVDIYINKYESRSSKPALSVTCDINVA